MCKLLDVCRNNKLSLPVYPPMYMVSLHKKNLWPESLVLTPISFQDCSLPLEPVFQSKLGPLTQFLTPFLQYCLHWLIWISLFFLLASICTDKKSCNHVLTSHFGVFRDWPPRIMPLDTIKGLHTSPPCFILVSPILRSLLEGSRMWIWEPCLYNNYFHSSFFSNYKSHKHNSYV